MRSLSGSDLEWLFAELAHSVRQGKPLAAALEEFARAQAGTQRGEVAARLVQAMAQGRSLADAAGSERCLPKGTAAALASGEKSGHLPDVLDALVEGVRLEESLGHSIAYAVVYPLVIALAAFAAIVFVHYALEPQFMKIFRELDINLPTLTTAGPAILRVEAFSLLFVPAAVLIVLYVLPTRRIPGDSLLDSLRLHVPLIGKVLQQSLLARWCALVGVLVRAGVPEAEAVRLAGESVGNSKIERISLRVSAQLEQGTRLGEAMARHRFFPVPLTWMVQTAEKTIGHVHVWPVAQGLYRGEATGSATVASVVLRVAFALLALQIIAVTVQAMFLPLIKLMNSLGG